MRPVRAIEPGAAGKPGQAGPFGWPGIRQGIGLAWLAAIFIAIPAGIGAPVSAGELPAREIFFNSDGDGNWDIWAVRPDGSGLRRLTRTPWDERDLAASADGRRLAYASGDGFVKVMDPFASRIVDSFATDARFNNASQPAFIDSSLLFSHIIDKAHDLSRISRYKGGVISDAVTQKGSLFYPAPLRGRNAFLYAYHLCSGPCGAFVTELWLHDLDARKSRQVTLLGSHIQRPAALDSDRVAFASDQEGVMRICLLSLASGKVETLTRGEGSNQEPAAAPDGSQLAYIHRSGGKSSIRIRTLATGSETEIRPASGNLLHLTW